MTDINSLTITKVIDAFTVNSPKGRKTVMQNRPSYGLSFCQSGQITYTHQGKSYISDADHAVILPKAQTYTLTGDKSGIFPVINFDCIGMPYDTIAIYRIKNPDVFLYILHISIKNSIFIIFFGNIFSEIFIFKC